MNRVNRSASVALAPVVAAITTRTSGSRVLAAGRVVISLLRCLLLVLLFPGRGQFHPLLCGPADHQAPAAAVRDGHDSEVVGEVTILRAVGERTDVISLTRLCWHGRRVRASA